MSSLRDVCSVCLENLMGDGHWNQELPNLVSTPCGHLFHGDCFNNWYHRGNPGNSCPLCRRGMTLAEAVPLNGNGVPQVPGPQVPQVPQANQGDDATEAEWITGGGAALIVAIIILVVYIWNACNDCEENLLQHQQQFQTCHENLGQSVEQLREHETKIEKLRTNLENLVNLLHGQDN